MHLLDAREPVSAWTHGAWMLAALLGLVVLWRHGGRHRAHRPSLLIFGFSLAGCMGLSWQFHRVRTDELALEWYRRLDHMGIYVLIAGTYTPVAWNLLCRRWRAWTLGAIWLSAAVGIGLHVAESDLPGWLETCFYLAMGWGSLVVYAELARRLSHNTLRLLVVGGVLYSVGAVVHVAHWPTIWPGLVGSHEVFHVLVMAGSLAHFGFMLVVVIPGARLAAEAVPPPKLSGAANRRRRAAHSVLPAFHQR